MRGKESLCKDRLKKRKGVCFVLLGRENEAGVVRKESEKVQKNGILLLLLVVVEVFVLLYFHNGFYINDARPKLRQSDIHVDTVSIIALYYSFFLFFTKAGLWNVLIVDSQFLLCNTNGLSND